MQAELSCRQINSHTVTDTFMFFLVYIFGYLTFECTRGKFVISVIDLVSRYAQ